jgi:Flp pilus assembly protein TadG
MKFFQQTRDDSGTEIAEAALVLPIVFLLMFAIFWFGRAFNVSSTLARAAKEGAQAASLSSCVTCGNTPNSNRKVADAVESVLAADKLNDANLQFYTPTDICTITPTPSCNTTAITASDGNSLKIKVCRGVPVTCGSRVSGCGSNSPPACASDAMTGTRVSMRYSFDWTHFSYDASTGNISKLPTVTLPASAQTVSEN